MDLLPRKALQGSHELAWVIKVVPNGEEVLSHKLLQALQGLLPEFHQTEVAIILVDGVLRASMQGMCLGSFESGNRSKAMIHRVGAQRWQVEQ